MRAISRGPWEGTIFRTKARGEQVYNSHKSPVYRVTPSHRGRQPFHLPRGNSSIFFYITVPWQCSEPHPMFQVPLPCCLCSPPLRRLWFHWQNSFPPRNKCQYAHHPWGRKDWDLIFFRKLDFPKKVSNPGNGGLIVEVNCLHRQDGNSIPKGNHTRGAEDQR